MKIEDLKVTQDNILIEPIKGDEEIEIEPVKGEADELIKPEQYEDKAYRGTIIKKGEKVSLPIGAIVYFNKYSSTEFEFEGKKYLVLKQEDVIAYYVGR